jgi:hypothetical protein
MRLPPLIRAIVRNESFRAIAVLIGVLHVPFFPCIWGNKTLMASSQDAPSVTASGAWYGPPAGPRFSRTLDNGGGGMMGEPNLLLLRHQYFVEHVPPLWNPYQGYGAPLAANQQFQPFYPLTVALLLHIGPRSYNWFLLARLFLAGIGSYFFLRFFVSFWAAIAGGITSMLAGYYILFLTMPQLSVEVLVPASLWAAEYLLRKRDYISLVTFATILLLVFLGGMPESALMLCVLLYSYSLFRIVSDTGLRASWRSAIGRLMAGTTAGIALAAFFLLPFWEFMRRSFDLHQPHNIGGEITGLSADPFGLSIFTYLFPLLWGPPYQGVFGIRNYVGLVAFFLLIVAVAAAVLPYVRRSETGDTRLRAITWFFFVFTFLLLAKRYGLPGLNAIGGLPFFQMLNFLKYEEVLLSICVSILGAIGVEQLLRHQLSVRVQAVAMVAAVLLIPLAHWLCRDDIRHEIADLHVRAVIPYMATLVASIAILWLGAVLAFSWRRKFTGGIDVPLGISVAALLAAEMSSNFILPTHYWHNKLAHMEHNPFAGAPYIDALKKVAGNWRVFARDGLLFPDWASAFQLYDIRNLDAMYDKKYFPFLQTLFSDQKNPGSDLGDRFTGTGDYDLTTRLAQRLFQLSSVKYIASIRLFTIPNTMIDEMMTQNRGHLIRGKDAAIAHKAFILSGEARDALGEHLPYKRVPYRIRVPNDPKAIFRFSYALDPAVFDKNGDGVGFLLEVRNPSGAITQEFSRYIDPKRSSRERRWMDGEVDLSAYRGQTVDLLFTTTAGPKGDSTYDWAAWSNFHFEGQPLGPAPPFHLIYNAEAKIYQYAHPLPRAAIYHHAALTHGANDTLRKLADPTLDVFQTVVLDESALSDAQRTQVADMNRQAPAPVQAASIRSYESQDVQIGASLDRAGILVLNDTAYPGWVVDVDGKAASWIDANYLFRGVLLSSGKHTVRFRYRPASFRRGAAVSGLAFAGLVITGLLRRRRRAAA